MYTKNVEKKHAHDDYIQKYLHVPYEKWNETKNKKHSDR